MPPRPAPTDADFGDDSGEDAPSPAAASTSVTAIPLRPNLDLGSSLTAMDWLPRVHVGTGDGRQPNGKPPHSYAELIAFAIKSVKEIPRRMTLADIYKYIMDKFPYYRSAGKGWKNSIRHNLSLNRMFTKIPRPKEDPGKGSYWAVDETVAAEAENGVVKTTKRKKKRSVSSPYLSGNDASRTDALESGDSVSSTTTFGGLSMSRSSVSNSSMGSVSSAGSAGGGGYSNSHSTSAFSDSQYSTIHESPPANSNSQDSSHHTAVASSAAPNFQDLNSSFRDLYQSVVDSATASADATPGDTAAPPVLSLDAMEQMMISVTQNKLLQSSVDQGMFKQTQALLQQCRQEVQGTEDLLESAKFPNLAQSFSHIFQQIGGATANSANVMHSAAVAMKQVDAEEEEEEEETEFDWDSIL